MISCAVDGGDSPRSPQIGLIKRRLEINETVAPEDKDSTSGMFPQQKSRDRGQRPAGK
jgi:hypothetical protein